MLLGCVGSSQGHSNQGGTAWLRRDKLLVAVLNCGPLAVGNDCSHRADLCEGALCAELWDKSL